MADVLPTTSNEHLELINASAPVYWKEASDLTRRGRIWLALMEQFGLMEFNADISYAGVWQFLYKLPEVVPQGDSASITFDEHTSLARLEVDLRGYRSTSRLSHKQWLQNRGSESKLVDLFDHRNQQLLRAMRKMINHDFYIDGYATNNVNRYIGINSFHGAGACAAGDKVARNNDNYGGQSTVQGALGGTWSSGYATPPNATLANDWPLGQGSEEYDPLSSLLVNETSTAWDSGSTWKTNCEEVLRWTHMAQANRGAVLEDANYPPLCLMDVKSAIEFREYFAVRNNQWIPIPEAVDLGFPETLYFEGMWITHDYDCPAGEKHLFNPGGCEYFSPQSDLFEVYGPEWSLTDMAFLYLVSNYANFRWQPKLFSKIYPIAA